MQQPCLVTTALDVSVPGDKNNTKPKNPQQKNVPNGHVDKLNMQCHMSTEQLLVKAN